MKLMMSMALCRIVNTSTTLRRCHVISLKLTGLIFFCAFSLPALAQKPPAKVDFGKHEFESRCASCHGASGKGDGPIANQLRTRPADLTVLAKNNGGILPVSRLYETIDGTGVAAHGNREMPVWGKEYGAQAGEYQLDPGYNREAYVRARILSLVEYINRLQQK